MKTATRIEKRFTGGNYISVLETAKSSCISASESQVISVFIFRDKSVVEFNHINRTVREFRDYIK